MNLIKVDRFIDVTVTQLGLLNIISNAHISVYVSQFVFTYLQLLLCQPVLLFVFEVRSVLQGSRKDLLNILTVGNLALRTVRVLLVVTKDVLDLSVQVLTSVTHEKDLKCFFDSDGTSERLIVHEELDEVVELSWLEIQVVADAALVHGLELLLVHEAIEIVIDFPNDQVDFRLGWFVSEELQCSGNIHRSNFVLMVLWFGVVSSAEVIEDSVELLLLDCLNLDHLELFGGAQLQLI